MRCALLPVLLLPLALGGCIVGTIAKSAVDVMAIPVKVVGQGIDAATTSQSEADQRRGRELRRLDEARARSERCAARRPLARDQCPGSRR